MALFSLLKRISSLILKPQQPRSFTCCQHVGLAVVLDPTMLEGFTVMDNPLFLSSSDEPLCLTLESGKSGQLKELGEESKSITSVIPLQQSVDTLLPIMEENMITEAPFEMELPSLLSSTKKACSSSLLSGRRKSIGSLRIHNDNVGSQLQESNDSERLRRVLFDNVKESAEDAFDSIKENVELKRLSLTEGKEPGEDSERSMCSDVQMQEFTGSSSPKLEENKVTENTSFAGEMPFERDHQSSLGSAKKANSSSGSAKKANSSSLLSRRRKSVPNKENLTPKVSGATTVKSLSKSHDRVLREVISKRMERIPFQCLLENSPSGNNDTFDEALNSPADQANYFPNCININKQEDAASGSNKDNLTPKDSVSQKSKRPLSNSPDGIQREEKMKKGEERAPFQSLMDNSSPRNCNAHNCSNLHTAQVLSEAGEEKKTWNIVVDASCLLDDQSRRSRELLEGLKGTCLIIPRIVIRELDCMKWREVFRTSGMQKGAWCTTSNTALSRTRKASSALSWIEMCMVRSSWWIHVQSSFEMLPIAATPPAFPSVQPVNGSNAAPSISKPFSSCGSLQEIVSPTAEDHILDCALLFKKLRNDAQFVLLTHSVTLKIKALAEGLICEAPTEFRQSLINPYSKRFLLVNSSPRGHRLGLPQMSRWPRLRTTITNSRLQERSQSLLMPRG